MDDLPSSVLGKMAGWLCQTVQHAVARCICSYSTPSFNWMYQTAHSFSALVFTFPCAQQRCCLCLGTLLPCVPQCCHCCLIGWKVVEIWAQSNPNPNPNPILDPNVNPNPADTLPASAVARSSRTHSRSNASHLHTGASRTALPTSTSTDWSGTPFMSRSATAQQC